MPIGIFGPRTLEGVLAGIPGIAGFEAARQQNNQQQMAQLQQFGMLSKIQEQQRAIQQEQELKGLLQKAGAESGGDPTKIVQSLLSSGNPTAIGLASKLDGLMPKKTSPVLVNTVAADGKTPVQRFVYPQAGDTYPAQTASDKKGTWGEPYQVGGAWVQRNSETGEIRTAVTREPQIKINNPPPTEPLVAVVGEDGKPKLLPRSQAINKTPWAGSPQAATSRPLTATAQSELFNTEDAIQASQSAVGSLRSALSINNNAMGFIGAGTVATAGSLLPEAIRPSTVDATNELDNLVTNSALPQLKAIFGGQPTEGERKILLEVAGSSSKNPSVRKGIYERAIAAAERRIQYNIQKASRIRDGTFFGESGKPSDDGWTDVK